MQWGAGSCCMAGSAGAEDAAAHKAQSLAAAGAEGGLAARWSHALPGMRGCSYQARSTALLETPPRSGRQAFSKSPSLHWTTWMRVVDSEGEERDTGGARASGGVVEDSKNST